MIELTSQVIIEVDGAKFTFEPCDVFDLFDAEQAKEKDPTAELKYILSLLKSVDGVAFNGCPVSAGDLKERKIKILKRNGEYLCIEDPNEFAVEIYAKEGTE